MSFQNNNSNNNNNNNNNNNKRNCLRSMSKVSNKTKFKKKHVVIFLSKEKKHVLCKEDTETFFDIILYIFDK